MSPERRPTRLEGDARPLGDRRAGLEARLRAKDESRHAR